MKRSFLALGLLTIALVLSSCRNETETKEVVREVEVEKVKEVEAEPKRKGILERTAEKVDQEVNKEIDEEIEKIGDDN
ncbi:hypothetical protein ACFQ3R_07710 [Mesonia ostreae]|uniref:Secreted protein n=1 Tax=Mesonia ostreae TaxID=861110 RepID=A0ABU2KM54_9FLAO|nr:hypothetical protein [Mesonia ostreae]MDT0295803.1 hypothetical protein [Mesonia ostreae]